MSKIKKVILFIVIAILIVIGGITAKIYITGFELYTYVTSNLVEKQIEDVISKNGDNYVAEELGFKSVEGDYLGFYNIKSEKENEYLIVSYDEKFNIGKNKVLNLKKIIKSSNSIAVMETMIDDKYKYFILLSIEDSNFESININSNSTNELIDNIELTDAGIEEYKGEKLKDKVYLIEYTPTVNEQIKVELVKKSEE